MAQYKVTITQTLKHVVTVTADCEERAKEIAEEKPLYDYDVKDYQISCGEAE